MEIPKKVKDEIWDYCRINDIPNIDEFILKMVSQGFTVAQRHQGGDRQQTRFQPDVFATR